jgi:DNA-binding transcriptional LysR family regulator
MLHDARNRDARPTLRELEALHALIEARKTTSAASMLGVSQPAISRAIQQLEARIGKQLFAREGGRLVATPDGLTLYQETLPVFATLDRLGRGHHDKSQPATIRLIAPPTIAHRFLPPLLAAFVRTEPQTQLHIEVGTTGDVIAKTADGSFDIGISDAQPAVPTVVFEPFRRARIHAIFPCDHRLAHQPEITAADLDGEAFIALTRRFAVRAILDRLFEASGVRPRIVVEAATSAIAYELVRSGLGFTLLNPFPVAFRADRDVAIIPFVPIVPFETVFVFPTATPTPPAARRFADFIRREQAQDGISVALH